MKNRRLMSSLALLLITLCAYAAFVGAMYLSQRVFLYPGAAFASLDSTEPAAWGQKVSITTPDGEVLHALHSPADTGKPSMLFLLGNADRVGNYRFLAEALSSRGFGLLAVSYRGYPGSTGSPSEEGLLIDGLAAYDWLQEHAQRKIVLLGQSLGSGVAVATAAKRPAGGVILISAYDSVLALAQSTYFFLPVGLLMKDTFRSDQWIAGVRWPKLFVHGRRDTIIPLARGQSLFASAPEPKTMNVYEGYGHNDIWSEKLIADIIGFVETLDE
jgi:uncharacterized protein